MVPIKPFNVLTQLLPSHTQVAITWDVTNNQCRNNWPITGCTVAIEVEQQGQIFNSVRYQDITPMCQEAYNNLNNNFGSSYVLPNICTVTVDQLQAEPFLLRDGESVEAEIVCTNTIGPSIASDVKNGAILPEVPSAPQGLTCSDRTASTITLRWDLPVSDGGSQITCYVITGNANNNFGDQIQQRVCNTFSGNQQTEFSTRTFRVTGLNNGSTYTFTVAAENVAGMGPANVVSQCLVCVTPSAPTGLREMYDARTLTSLGITWSPGFDNGATNVFYTVSIARNDIIGDQERMSQYTDVSLVQENLIPGDRYTYQVQASNICGASAMTPALTLTVGTNPG